ncbi:MAG: phenylalanine--tRNA ligase subunit alpha [Verrucomicrobia bacterium GWF2_51_19]|nr:MAG: phenylalanine--tRNA ligase subunit alpha [Verrucomicrobia bacterium GWF2_51_19]HCJ12350.1 phenylalanine--tRNA ligase subunit alpha [Opitutae bacterium]
MNIDTILIEAKTGRPTTRAAFEAYKAKLVGANGALTQVIKGIGKLPPEERPAAGQAINQVKKELESIFNERLVEIEAQERKAVLGTPVDPNLPTRDKRGRLHPLTQVRNQLTEIFAKIGFVVAEGPEIESEWYCLDALNIPQDHPARDAQDTLYFPKQLKMGNVNKKADEQYILRTHTSSVQIRAMLKNPPPLRIIAPGRVFRRDTVDATHSACFHQIEGLYVDKGVTVCDLKDVLDHFLKELFGNKVEIRLRPSFFPFTEPSFELDLKSPHMGALSNQWIEILGCGIVDPAVFDSVGYDSHVWSGYAFGAGIERIAMLLYGIDDVRLFYQNDLRFL